MLGSTPMLPMLDKAIAERANLSPETFVTVFGAGWELAPAQAGDSPSEWFVVGEPAQLMLTIDGLGDIIVARPRGVWNGVAGLTFVPEDQTGLGMGWAFDRDGARQQVRTLLTSRRRSFRYCPSCLGLTPPELMDGRERCMGCAQTLFGTVY